MLWQKQIEKEGFIWAHSWRLYCVIMEKSQWQGCRTAPTLHPVNKQRQTWHACCPSVPFLHFCTGSHSGNVATHSGHFFLSQCNQENLLRHTWRLFSQGTQDVAKLTTNTEHHRAVLRVVKAVGCISTIKKHKMWKFYNKISIIKYLRQLTTLLLCFAFCYW